MDKLNVKVLLNMLRLYQKMQGSKSDQKLVSMMDKKFVNLDQCANHYYALHFSHSTCTPTCWCRTQLNDTLEDNSDSDYTPEPASQKMTCLYKHKTAFQDGSQCSLLYICRHPYPFDSCSLVHHLYQLLTTVWSLHLLVQPQHIQQNLNIRLIHPCNL